MAYPLCPLAITDQIFSDWQDGHLPQARAQEVGEHIPTCLGCQQRTADFATATNALRNERIPYLQDRIWRGMQAQAQGNQRKTRVPGQSGILSIVGLATVTLLMVLFVSLVTWTHRAGVSSGPTVIARPTATSTTSPTAVPNTDNLTPAQAWGTTNNQIMTIDNQKYRIRALLPNSAGVVGETYDTNYRKPPIIVLIRYPSLTVQTLFTTSTWNNANVATDGRYVAWAGGFNATGGPGSGQETVGFYDLQTGQTRTLISGATDINVTTLTVSHGMLLIPINTSTHSVLMINLATGVQQRLLPPGLHITVSWPYLLALGSDSGTITNGNDLIPAILTNLQTQKQTDVTQLLQQKAANFYTFALDGSTIFTVYNNSEFEEIDHADQPGARARYIFTTNLNGNSSLQAADSRIVLVANLVAWDRLQQRLITLPLMSPDDIRIALLDNGVLAYWQSSAATSPLVLRDDANLPTSPVAP